MTDEQDEFVFKVFIPDTKEGHELKNRLISYAKLYHDNKIWKVLQEGMAVILESDEVLKTELYNRVLELEEKVAELKDKKSEKDKDENLTFGGDKNE